MQKWGRALTLAGIGWYIALCIVIGAVVGVWLDRQFGTRILLTLIGLTFGLVLAMFGAYRMVVAVMKDTRDGGK